MVAIQYGYWDKTSCQSAFSIQVALVIIIDLCGFYTFLFIIRDSLQKIDLKLLVEHNLNSHATQSMHRRTRAEWVVDVVH